MDIYISNATPESYHLGTNDKSGRAQIPVPLTRPQHLAYIPFYAEKGPVEEMMVDGNAFANIYGAKTLDPKSPYYNHSSVFLQGLLQDANTVIAKRIVPPGAEKLAGLLVCVEYYTEDSSPVLKRDDFGNFIKKEEGGYEEVSGKNTKVIKYRFLVKPTEYKENSDTGTTIYISQFGKFEAKDNVTGFNPKGNSKVVPLFELAASSPGAWANLCGISIWSPTTSDPSGMNTTVLSEGNAYPFRIAVKEKKSLGASPRVVTTIEGARELDFTLKPGTESKSGLQYYLGDNFIKAYNDLHPENPTMPPTIGHFSKLYIYQKQVDKVLEDFFAAEKEASSQEEHPGLLGDFQEIETKGLSDEKAKYLVNLFGARYSDGTPYQALRKDESTNTTSEVFTPYEANVKLAQGGTDGDLNNVAFETAVDAILDEFANVNGKYMDNVTFNDSTFWDTGYSLKFKKNIGRYLSNRKDRWVGVTTFVACDPDKGGIGDEDEHPNGISPAEENSRLAAIISALRAIPDSAIFGTPAYRAVVVKGSGRFLPSVSTYHKRVPVLYELMRATAKFAGAANGKASPRFDLAEGDNNYVRYLNDISNPWTPFVVRNKAWAAGGVWVERSESGRFFFPGIRTIYEDQSSTLMNFRIMLCHVELNKIGAELQRRFTGKDWQNNRLKQEAESWFYQQISGNKFAGKLDIQGELTFTEIDLNKSWAWHFTVSVYGDNIKTVQTFYSENYRRSDKDSTFTGVTA